MPRNALARQPWFKVPCCPPNVALAIATLGGYPYATSDDALYINQYLGSTATVEIGDRELTLVQKTHYPWDGHITITLDPDRALWEGTICLRIPAWCRNFESTLGLYHFDGPPEEPSWTMRINGRRHPTSELHRGFLSVTRAWRINDRIELELPKPVRRVLSHTDVAANRRRVALQRGPLVYCIEAADHDGSVRDIVLPTAAELRTEHRGDFLGGVTVIEGAAERRESADVGGTPVCLFAVQYAVSANREIGEMDVWLSTERD